MVDQKTGKKGKISVKDGESDDKALSQLVNNFVLTHGIKKDLQPRLFSELQALVDQHNTQMSTIRSNDERIEKVPNQRLLFKLNLEIEGQTKTI